MGKRLGIAILAMAALAGGAQAACVDHGVWDKVLRANVDDEGFVDYEGIRVNRGGDLYQYISFLETADLTACNDSERTAFWINAYNAHVIRLILARPRLEKVSDDFKLFGEKFKVAKHNLDLNDIEHAVLRRDPKKGGPIEGLSPKEFDPRVHTALVCGAIDCPKLLNRAYQPGTLEAALENNSSNFASKPKHIRVENGTLYASSLLKWYADDFGKYGGAKGFLLKYIDPTKRPDAAALTAKIQTDFPDKTQFRYDWTLNSVKNRPKSAAPAAPKK